MRTIETIDPSDANAIYFDLEGSLFETQLEAPGAIFFTYKTLNNITSKLIELSADGDEPYQQ